MNPGTLTGVPDGGSVDSLAGLAAAARRAGDEQEAQAHEVRRARGQLGGQGATVGAVRDRLAQVADRLDDLAAAHAAVREVAERYAGELAEIQDRARRLRADEEEAIEQAHRYRRLVLEEDPTVGHLPWQAPPSRRMLRDQRAAWALAHWQEAVADHDRAVRAWGDLVDEREQLDRWAGDRLDGIPELDGLRPRLPGARPGAAAIVTARLWAGAGAGLSAEDLAALGDAAAVRAAWDQLSDAQRQRLITDDPMVMGNLDGIPIGFRAQANRLNMQAEIDRIDRQLAAIGTASIDNQLRPGETIEGLRAARATYRYFLDSAQTVYDRNGMPTTITGVPVVVFDPEAEAIATYRGPFDALGDVPSWIANIAIHVPGTGTNLGSFGGTDERSLAIYRSAKNATTRPGVGPTAVFGWAGGHFPQNIDAASDADSRVLGPRLRDFAAAIDTHPGRSTLTVTGHSYGGAVVGMAEAAGLRADRVLYVAGAGLGNDTTRVADFPHTGDVPHYALMARNDALVGYIQGLDVGHLAHGASPLHDPDVVRLETGFLNDEKRVAGRDVESLGPTGSHSGVYRAESTSFKNIVQVIVGGQVETFAPDTTVVTATRNGGATVHRTDGIDRHDYVPHMMEVE